MEKDNYVCTNETHKYFWFANAHGVAIGDFEEFILDCDEFGNDVSVGDKVQMTLEPVQFESVRFEVKSYSVVEQECLA